MAEIASRRIRRPSLLDRFDRWMCRPSGATHSDVAVVALVSACAGAIIGVLFVRRGAE